MMENAPHVLKPALYIRLGIWNIMYRHMNRVKPRFMRSLNIRTDCGFSGEEKSIGTSAGLKSCPDFPEFVMLRVIMKKNAATTIRSVTSALSRS